MPDPVQTAADAGGLGPGGWAAVIATLTGLGAAIREGFARLTATREQTSAAEQAALATATKTLAGQLAALNARLDDLDGADRARDQQIVNAINQLLRAIREMREQLGAAGGQGAVVVARIDRLEADMTTALQEVVRAARANTDTLKLIAEKVERLDSAEQARERDAEREKMRAELRAELAREGRAP